MTVWGVVEVNLTGGVKVRPCAGLSPACTPAPGTGEPNGGRGTVIDGPTTLDGYTWWKIQWEDGKLGWSAEQIDGACVLKPCTATTSSPNAGANVSFPQDFTWSNNGPCINFTLAFATSTTPSTVYTFDSSGTSKTISASDWTTAKATIGNATTYYWAVGQVVGTTSGNIFAARTSWRSFSVVTLAPNLTPSIPTGWSGNIVIAKTTGATSDGADFTAADTLYASWGIKNIGNASAGPNFYNTLYLDDNVVEAAFFNSTVADGTTISKQDISLGKLSAGSHTIKIKADSGLSITESDETDNEYSRTITVSDGKYSLTVAKSPSDAGTVSVNPPADVDGKYANTAVVTLAAIPSSGYSFARWEGSLSGNIPEMPLAMSQNRSVTAVFISNPPTPSVTVSPPTVDGVKVTVTPSTVWKYLVELADTIGDSVSWRALTVYAAESAPNPKELLLSANLNQMYCRITPYTVREYPGFLRFPIEQYTDPYKVRVSAILDHSWNVSNVVRTYRNEEGRIAVNDGETIGMKKDAAGTEFNLEFMYADVNGKKSILQYDSAPKYNVFSGHKGYDYPASPTTDWVVAAYDGELDKAECKRAGVVEFNGLVLKHAFGVRTYYLHMPYSSWAISSDLDSPTVVTVKKGDHLGRPGHKGVTNDHLHFGVYTGTDLADPYGEFTIDGTQIQPILWDVHP